MPSWHHEMPPPMPEFITLVTRNGWSTILTGREATALETNALPAYVAKQRWFVGKDDKIARTRIAAASILGKDKGGTAFLQVAVDLAASGQQQRYLLPLAASWDEEAGTVSWPLLPATVAKIRRHNQIGAVYEATATDGFAAGVIEALRSNTQIDNGGGKMIFQSHADLSVEPPPEIKARRIGGEQSNTSLAISDRYMLKIYRRLADGAHPEVEMLRFLTGPAKYASTPKLLGSVEYVERDGTQRALAILQEFVRTQGDGWAHAMNYLDRVFDGLREVGSAADAPPPAERHAAYLEQIRVLGQRVAELHCALASATDDPAFRAEPVTAGDMAAWREDALRLAKSAFAALRKASANGDPVAAQARALVERRSECLDRINALSAASIDAMKTRIHGDLHLGQVLVVKNDFHIIDFEGEPARSLAGRRAKTSPMRDIAGMLRSIHYAAWAALFGLRDRDPDGFEKLFPYAMEWRAAVQEAFLAAYVDAVGSCPSWPADAREGRRLLNLFVLEKVLYEIHYEATNRPSWLRIPVAGLREVLDALSSRREDTLAAA